jgi:predicted RNase H-like HicB family nuclease
MAGTTGDALAFAETVCSPWHQEFDRFHCMKAQFTYWKESDGRYLGYLNDYPDHWTQGESLDDLKEQLRDLFQTFSSEQIPGIRKVEELEIA